MFWSALEPGSEDLGAWRGEGQWGVSTLNPTAIGDIYVTLFKNQADAISYARERAYSSGELYERDPRRDPMHAPEPTERGRVYYVFHAPSQDMDTDTILPLFRVMRGRRGGGAYLKGTEQVLVQKNDGVAHTGKIRWKLSRGLTVTVPDYEHEQDLRAARRTTEVLTREDAGRLPRGQKQRRVRQGRRAPTGGAAGPVVEPGDKAAMLRYAAEQRRHQRRVEQQQAQTEAFLQQVRDANERRIAVLRNEIARLTDEKDYIEVEMTGGTASARQVANRERIIERIDEIQRELEALEA